MSETSGLEQTISRYLHERLEGGAPTSEYDPEAAHIGEIVRETLVAELEELRRDIVAWPKKDAAVMIQTRIHRILREEKTSD